ncbi:ImmA/IrrE family metallo-endopeptidase [Bacillus sp. OTU530]|uniref:ImmA/IrrE family metallo-endopeptidase n=1 Tax=Bacillus sp. OTU530 TaxID=3043862 RepID=UPI00313F0AB6
MFSGYRTTPLEDWVTTFYKRIGIQKPSDLQIDIIAEHCDVILIIDEAESSYIITDLFQIITLDSRLSPEKQKETFFHELCHILRHEGMQGKMPYMFREWQEWDAVNFTKYAAIPAHMLQYIRLDRDSIAEMSNLFKVTPELCKARLEQIRNRLYIRE